MCERMTFRLSSLSWGCDFREFQFEEGSLAAQLIGPSSRPNQVLSPGSTPSRALRLLAELSTPFRPLSQW